MRRHSCLVARGAMRHTTTSILFAAMLLAVIPAFAEDDAMLEPGQPFPAFSLPAHDGTTVSSAELAGAPFLLFFYPKADTGG